ncbi:LacI family DNA-binding transcriptional regulator [Mucilaginibacter ginsenosidivorax]|uniref:LacI family transcriptional regulator n=1 Tax=Mucilaginibacter ginsenosidivorax TaxID=862126 RepID=A0A5B8VU09_9SPHI|nr:substrate-binding domain-containing protein [Mucilaginibacter ginsenosidivorax]QEC75097.1 LacI family transcriptional regulator [Mucilaginibacter ginsenosidivorax]
MKKKLSIVDIANALNVSKTTISFILNGRAQEKRIGADLVEKVMKYVAEVGYKPNSLAKSLRTGKSNTIGLMVEDISNPFFASIARLIEDRAYKNGYKIIYCSTDNDTSKTQDLINMFRDRHVDGYIMAPPEGIEEDIESLIKDGMPVVLFDRHLPGVKTDVIEVDNLFSTYNATRHLMDQGFKNIAFVTFASHQTQMMDRVRGYQDAMKSNGLRPTIVKEIVFNQDEEQIMGPLRDFFKGNPDVDAILFGTNHIGTCGLKIMHEMGLKAPTDIAVISFDDYDVFKLHSPPITAIAQPVEEIADNVITVLLEKLNDRSSSPKLQSIILKTDLKIRNSSLKNAI